MSLILLILHVPQKILLIVLHGMTDYVTLYSKHVP